MEEVLDFEGFTLNDYLLSMRCKRNHEETLKRNSICHHSSTTEMRKGRPCNHTINREIRTDTLRFWQVKEQYTFDIPHTACDNGSWFEKVMTDLSNDRHQKLELTYCHYKKVVNLESSVNITMFMSDCNEITTQFLWEQLVQRITGRISKRWLEVTLILSPLFSFDDVRKVWKRKGISLCGERNQTYPFIHWLGVLDQRKAWAGLCSPEQNAEFRMETIKAILLKHNLLTVEDIAKIICTTFMVPQCPQLTELVHLSLTACKIFHKSQDQEDGVTNSVHLQHVAPRLSETKRISKPSQHYRRAVRTAALYEGLMFDGNTSEPSIDLEIKNVRLKIECKSTQNSPYEEPVKRETQSQLMSEKYEETEFKASHDQSYLLTKAGMLDSDSVQCSLSKPLKLNSHRQLMNEQYEHILRESCHDQTQLVISEDLPSKKDSHNKTGLSKNEKQLSDDYNQHLQVGQEENSCTNNNKHFTSDKMKVKSSQKCQPLETKDMEDSLSLYCLENEDDCSFSGDSSDDDSENEQSLILMEDSDSEISQKNPLISFTSLMKSSKRWQDNEEYMCPLFARTSYYISTPHQTLKDTLPNQLQLSSRDTSLLVVVKSDGGLLTHLKKSEIHSQNKDTSAELGNISNKEASKVCSTKSSISNGCLQTSESVRNSEANSPVSSEKKVPSSEVHENLRSNQEVYQDFTVIEPIPSCTPPVTSTRRKACFRAYQESNITSHDHAINKTNMPQQNSDTGKSTFSNLQSEGMLPVSSKESHISKRFNKGDGISRHLPHELNGEQKEEPLESSKEHVLSQSQKDNKTLRQNSLLQDSPKTGELTKELRMFRNNRSILSSATMESPPLGIRSPSDSHQPQCMIEKNAEDKECISLPDQKDEIIKDASTNNSSGLQCGPGELDQKKYMTMENEELKQQNTHVTVNPTKEHSYARNTVEKPVMKNNLNRQNVVKESVKQSESSRICVAQNSEDLGMAHQHEKQTIKNSPEACNVTQDHLTTKSSDHLLASTSPAKQKTDGGNTNTLKRQRWKSFKLRDNYEENVYQIKVKKIYKPRTHSFDEATLKRLKKPLMKGWIRELVQRIVSASSNKDVYYHTPEGKKLRSSVEVDKYLETMRITGLTRENFTFYRAELGFGEPFEIVRNAARLMRRIRHSPDKQGQGSSWVRRKRLVKGNTNTIKSEIKESFIISDALPNDRFWITCFDDLENSMETDTTEIVNENGELTGFEEWSVDGVVHASVASTSTSSVPTSESLSTATTASITTTASTSTTCDTSTTPSTSTTLNALTPPDTSTTPSSSVTLNTFTTPSTSTTLNTFTKFNSSFTPNITTTFNTPVTPTISILPNISSTYNISTIQSTSSTSNTANTSTILGSIFANRAAKPHTTSVISTCNSLVSKTKSSCSTATVPTTLTSQTSIPISLMITTYNTTPTSGSIATTQAVSTTCSSTSTYDCIIHTTGSKTTAQTSTPKMYKNLTSSVPTPLTVAVSGVGIACTAPTLVSSDNITHTRPLISPDSTTHSAIPIASPDTSIQVHARASPTNTSDTLGTLTNSSTPAFFSTPHSHSNIYEDNKPASLIQLSFEPRILKVYNPADAQRLYDMLDSPPDPDSKRSHSSVSTLTQQLSEDKLKGGIIRSLDCERTKNKSKNIDEQINTDFTYVVPTSKMDRNSVTKIRVKDDGIRYSHTSRRQHVNSTSQPPITSDKNRNQLSTPKFNNKQHSGPFLDNRQESVPLSRKWQQPLSKKRDNHQFTEINSNMSQVLKSGNTQQPRLNKGYEQHSVVIGSKEQQPISVSTNKKSLATLSKSLWPAPVTNHKQEPAAVNNSKQQSVLVTCNIQQPFSSMQQSLSVNSGRQISGNSKSQKTAEVIDSKLQSLLLSSNAQYSTVNNSSQQPTPSNNQDSTPVPSKIQQSAPVMNYKQQSTSVDSSSKLLPQIKTPVTTNIQQLTSLATIKQQSTLVTTSRQQTTPVISSRQQTTPVISSRQQTTPVFSSKQQTIPVVSSRQQTTPVSSSRQQTTPVSSSRQQTTPVSSSRQQTTPVCSSRQQTTPVTNSRQQTTPVFSSSQQTTPVFSSRQQINTVISSRQLTTPVINSRQQTDSVANSKQQTDPVVNSKQQTDPVVNSKQQTDPVVNSKQQTDPVVSSRQQTTPVFTSMQQTTPVFTSRQQTTPVFSSRQQTTPVINSRQQTDPVISRRQLTTPVRQQISPVISSRQQITPVINSRLQTIPAINSRQQTTPVISSRQQTIPVISSRQQTTPVTNSRQQTDPVISSRQQSTPVTESRYLSTSFTSSMEQSTLPINSSCNQQLTPIIISRQQSVLTSSTQQSPLLISSWSTPASNCSYDQQSTPVISSRQQLTTSVSSKEQSSPVTDNNQFIPVMSIQQSLTPISDVHQSLPSPGNRCQVSQHKADDQHLKFVMSNDEQKTLNSSNDNKIYPDNSHIIPIITKIHHVTPGVSNPQETLPVISKVQQKNSDISSVYQTIPLVSEGQPEISDMSDVEQIIQHTNYVQHLIPEEQIIPIMSNTQLTSIPKTLSEPVVTVTSIQDSSAVPQVSNSLLAPVVTSYTTESRQKQSVSTPWKIMSLPHRNNELQYMVILPKEKIEHNKTPEITIKSIEKVKSMSHVKDSTCYGNKSNHAKVKGKQMKQTARKSTKSRPTRSKPAAPADRVFVDVGILSVDTEDSMTENNEIVSEPDRIRGGATDISTDMQVNLDLMLDEINHNINSFQQTFHFPEVANVLNTVQSFSNISDNTMVRPPPPLKQFFPQTKRKITRVTCPPLIPIHKMTKLSPETSLNSSSHLVPQRQTSSSLSENSSSYLPQLQDHEHSVSQNMDQ
ncbi:mucin-17-like [Scylla paramamosain]|uniref:mucin-17-like n=1 Tax=Scylla paramamosain TaxID=85552 RepID=UPI0030837F94